MQAGMRVSTQRSCSGSMAKAAPRVSSGPSERGRSMVTRAASWKKMTGLGTGSSGKTQSGKTQSGSKSTERPVSPARAAAVAMPGWLPREVDERRPAKKRAAPTWAPKTRREALFAIAGTMLGASSVGGYFMTRFDVDKEAARVALDSVMQDPAFRRAMVDQIVREKLGSSLEVNQKALTAQSVAVDQELSEMRQQMKEVTLMVNEMTADAEARTAASNAAAAAQAARAARAAEVAKPPAKKGWFGGLFGC